MRLLLVEDDAKAARVLSRGLREEGFVVDVAPAGDIGQELAAGAAYDVIVLDWLLPRRDGLSVCRGLRERDVATPILMLTARDALADRVRALDSGADDFLAKPFAFDELLARIRALLRRSGLTRPPVLKLDDVTLDPATHRVARAGVEIDLTAKEYAILEFLIRHVGQVVSRTRVAHAVWPTEPADLNNLVDVHVSHLRRKIDGGAATSLIETVRGHGFRVRQPEE